MAFRKGLRRGMAALLCVGMLFSNMELYPVESRAAQQKTVTGSNVSYLKYQRDEVLEVAGEPFFYNGVQIRADKVTDVYDFTNEQVEELFRTAAEDGFTVAKEEEGFVLYDGEKTAPILMDASYEESGLDTHPERSYTQVTRAVNDLRQDVGMVTGAIDYREIQQIFNDDAEQQKHRLESADAGKVPQLLTERKDGQTIKNAVIIGTISGSGLIRQMMQAGKLEEAKGIEGEWESYVIKEVENPIEGVENALVIAGSDARGTIYGIYTISEEIGVSPFYWYSDVPVQVRDQIVISSRNTNPIVNEGPDVKYRGIFINDEDISVLNWAAKKFADEKAPGVNYYRHVFELLLRLKCNLLWPAMHEVSAAFCTEKGENGIPVDSEEASQYGIVIGSSHCDILLRTNTTEWADWYHANKENYDIQGSDSYDAYDFSKNETAVLQYWRERLQTNKEFESILTLGIRGVHDGAFNCDNLSKYKGSTNAEKKVSFMEEVIKKQRRLIAEVYFDGDMSRVDEVPQVLIPYKEMGTVYNDGLNEFIAQEEYRDITLMWAEDNFGYVRQTPTDDEAAREGGTGIYYHSSYYGSPSCYLWLNSIPLAQMSEQLHRAYDTGMRNQWVLNVGDIKPGDQSLEFYAKMSWDVDAYNDKTVESAYLVPQATRDYGMDEETAKKTAAIMQEYYSIIAAKKPEFYTLGSGANPFSTTSSGDEALLWLARCQNMAEQMTEIYEALSNEYQAAFYEQIYYHVLSVQDAAEEYIYYWKALQGASQGRVGSTKAYIALSMEARDRILSRVEDYGSLNGNKWEGYISWQHVGSWGRDDWNHDILKDSEYPDVPKTGTGVGAAAENQESSGSGTLSFHSLSKDTRYFDVFSREAASKGWVAETSDPWILLSESGGSTATEERVRVNVDWSQISGTQTGAITIYNADDNGRKIQSEPVAVFEVEAVNKGTFEYGDIKGYVEANGYVMIEAEDYSENLSGSDGSQWQEIWRNGQRGNTMKAMPDTAAYTEDFENTARLIYNVYFEKAGTYRGTFFRLPTLNEGTDDDGRVRTCRTAIGANGQEPEWLRGKSSWEEEYNYNSPANVWSRNIMRMYEPLSFNITVKQGWNQIIVYRMEASIVFDRILIETQEGAVGNSLLGPVESPNNISGSSVAVVADLPAEVANTVIRPDMELDTGDGATLYTGQDQIIRATSRDERVAQVSVHENGQLYVKPVWAGTTTIQVEFAQGNFSFQVKVNPDDSKRGAYLEEDGLVIIQATDAAGESQEEAMEGSGQGHEWRLSGIGLQVQPDEGAKWTDGSVEALEGNAPCLSFQVNISQPGTYRLFVNTSNPDADADSYHLAVDGSFCYTDTNGNGGTATGKETWYGGDGQLNLTEGLHTIQIYAREDGFCINQLALTTGSKPDGLYEEGSRREEGQTEPSDSLEERKKLLSQVYEAYKGLELDGYTKESSQKLTNAIEYARAVLLDEKAGIEDLEEAITRIVSAASGLVVDTTQLEEAKKEAEEAKKEAEELLEKLEAEQKKLQEQQKEVNDQKEELKQLVEQAKDQQAELSRLQNESKEAKERYDLACKSVEAKRSELERLQKEAEVQKQELDRLLADAKSQVTSFTSQKTALKTVKSFRKKQVRVTWKKVEGAEGYIIQYASDPKLKSARKAKVMQKNAQKKIIKKLKSKRNYYFRIRAFKTVDGKKVYTKYSSTKKVRIK